MRFRILIAAFVAVVVSLFAPSVSAQTVAAASYDFKVYNAGASAPLSTTNVLASSFVCNQAKPTTGNNVNPTRMWFDDPASPATKACIYLDPGTGVLVAVPISANPYVATLTAKSSTGIVSAESNQAPFTRPGSAPGTPANFTIGS